MYQKFARAVQLHRDGNLQAAEELYLQIVQADPRNADAWHFLGLLARQVGRLDLAAENIRQSLVLSPDSAPAHFNLANILREQGLLEQAAVSYRRALDLKPDFAEAHGGLGSILHQRGDWAAAEVSFREALRLRPNSPGAHGNLGNVLKEQGRLEDAAARYRVALSLAPNSAEAHCILGSILQEQGKLEEAKSSYEEALRRNPALADAHNNLGSVLKDQNQLEKAELSLKEALRLNPALVEAHANLGSLYKHQHQFDKARACFMEALRLNPELADGHYHLSLFLLLLGEYANGWREYEWRLRTKAKRSSLAAPATWDGADLNGRTILLQAEEGLGDTMNFIRYASLVKLKGGRVIVQCQPSLLRILAGCPGIDELVPQGESPPAHDVSASLLSLPMLCGTTLENIPAQVPYIHVGADRVDRWRDQLAAFPGFKIGINWQGNPAQKDDRRRSPPLKHFAPLAAVPGVSLIVLQRGPGLDQMAQAARQFNFVDLPGRAEEPAETWLDTAALIKAVDMVITSDTAVAHLAGALAVPVWTLLCYTADWRFLLDREDCPWYPTMRLFRQKQPGDWAEVFQRVADELRKRLEYLPRRG